MKKDSLKIVERPLKELKPCEYNPRKISSSQRKQIMESVKKFGIVDPLVINTNENRKNIIVGGNQRSTIYEELGYESVPCVEVNLDIEGEKELNVRLNKNQAEFDFEALNEIMNRDLLLQIGFKENELTKLADEYEEKVNAIKDEDAQMPITPKHNEKYGVVMIYAKEDVDLTWLKNFLGIDKSECYKTDRIAENFVIDVKQLQQNLIDREEV